MSKISELVSVDLKEVWPHEAHDFTPWLAENLDRLESLLGMDLELEGTEVAVGPFSADIVAQEATTGRRMVIENMLGSTDHDHLGKMLTYAAGLDAWYCVLIAKEFRPEHKSALAWLNAAATGVGFFGVEISAVRIADSPPAAQLSLVVEPDDWARQTPKPGLSLTQQNYLAFWTGFLPAFYEHHPTWGNVKTPSTANWLNFPSGYSGMPYELAFSWPTGIETYQLRASLYIGPAGEGEPERIFNGLLENKELIEERFGGALLWDRNEEKISCRVSCVSDFVNPTDENRWEEYAEWFISHISQLKEALTSSLKNAVSA